MPKTTAKQAVEAHLKADGYSIYQARSVGIDLFCVKDGRTVLVKVSRGKDDSNPILQLLRNAGLDVRVEGAPKNPSHDMDRVVTSVSYRGEDRPAYEKLRQILKNKGIDYSQWVREQTYGYVTEQMQMT